MFKVESLTYEQLTEEEQEQVPDNGAGKELAHYIRITNDYRTAVYSDAMEPEDTKFTRDLAWVQKEIEQAYAMGLERAMYGLPEDS